MNLLNLKVNYPKGRYNSYLGQIGKIKPNILNRNFIALKPLEKITTDVTEFKLPWGKCYLQCYLDLYNQEILNYQISKTAEFKYTKRLLDNLIKKYDTHLINTIIHSDRGWQYQHPYYQQTIQNHHLIQSMSHKGNCYDNVIIENFFGKLKIEMFYNREYKYKNFNQFKSALIKYINYYNHTRIKLNLGYSPVNYRLRQAN